MSNVFESDKEMEKKSIINYFLPIRNQSAVFLATFSCYQVYSVECGDSLGEVKHFLLL